MPVTTYDGLFNPLLRALRELGGSASVAEQESAVARILKLTPGEEGEIHRGNGTKLSYRLQQLEAGLRAPAASQMLSYGALKLLPFWDPLRGDPRFEQIVASLAPKDNESGK